MKKITKIALFLMSSLITTHALAAEKCHLKVWEDDKKSMGTSQAVADFEKDFDCTVTVEEVNFLTQTDKMRLEGPTGNGPDVFLIPADRMGSGVMQGLITPIKFMQEEQDRYIRSAVSAFSQNGEIYAVPKVVETLVMFYNKDYLKHSLLTFEDYFDYSKKLVSENNGKYGLLAKWDSFYYAYGAIQPFGAYVFGSDPDGNIDANDVGLSNDGAVEGVEFIKSFFASGCFPPDLRGKNGIANVDRLFTEGNAAAVINGPWALEPYSNSKINFGVAPLPILPNGKPMSSFLGVKGYVISAWAKNHDLAEEFLHYINQPKYAKIRYQETREIPPVKAVMADPVITNDEFANAIAVQASRAVPMPSVPEMSEVWGPIDAAFDSIITGRQSVKDGLKTATEHINYQIEAFRAGMQ
ncbi:extracellular solute-binding protein [Succinivibrio sp.]|uniref:extracellular solute-binding protein n=1 Tax=Succinivibrio sp. TaxID=2053619 RepID=UPI00259010FD|nr:extracellular solute-binding protein [Succinivibrio sp.]MDD6205466.1 extracellular solute-binding protein [Succinivibrio sp.]